MLDKVSSGEEAHWGPPGMYAAIFGITAFPSAWIVLRSLPGSWADRMQAPVRFLLAWAVPSVTSTSATSSARRFSWAVRASTASMVRCAE